MHQSATDIASFTTGRASILIGPRGAFGAQKQHLLLRDASRIRAELDRLLLQDSNRMMLRPYIARWGLDTNVLTRSDRSHLADWLTQKAAAGILGIVVVPDPVIAFAGLVEKQETIVLTLKGSQALQISKEPGKMLPAGLDDRFLILLSMVPDHMEGAVKRKFTDMIDAIGLEVIAVGLLMWIGAHFIPGLNLVVLAFDLFFLSGEVMRAIEVVAKSIDDVALARTRSDLTPIAKILAAAIAVLIVNGVLNRFLKAKKITRGQSKSSSGRGRKRTRQSTSAASSGTSRPPRKKPKNKQSDSGDSASSGSGNSGTSGSSSAGKKSGNKTTINDRRAHHQDKVDEVATELRSKGCQVIEGPSMGGAAGKGRCMPDIIYRTPDGNVKMIEVKTGDAVLSKRQAEIFPQIKTGNAVPKGKVAKDFGLIPGVPLKDQGFPGGIEVSERRFPGID